MTVVQSSEVSQKCEARKVNCNRINFEVPLTMWYLGVPLTRRCFEWLPSQLVMLFGEV